jgi:CubicO group peptidase (beta-lactamase class C family)
MKRAKFLYAVVLALVLSACAKADSPPTPTAELLIEDASLATMAWWSESSPEAQGMDSTVLVEMLKAIENGAYATGIHEIVIVRHGSVVLDATIYPFSLASDSKHEVFSCTKSVLSTLIGIAIDQGSISGIDQPILELFPDLEIDNLDARKKSITLEDVLTMSAGLDCRDSYLYEWEGLRRMHSSGDWAEYLLDLPMIAEPGTKFEYCNGGSHLLSVILQNATGQTALDFAVENLFGPLEITDVAWGINQHGESVGYSELEMHAEDLAKIGYLILREGQWDGERIVSESWIEQATSEHIEGTLQEGYGYQWWVDESGVFMGLGYGGQYLIVAPDDDLVVVFLSELPDQQFYLPDRLFNSHILPAVVSNEPLPEDERATTLLNLYKQALKDP